MIEVLRKEHEENARQIWGTISLHQTRDSARKVSIRQLEKSNRLVYDQFTIKSGAKRDARLTVTRSTPGSRCRRFRLHSRVIGDILSSRIAQAKDSAYGVRSGP